MTCPTCGHSGTEINDIDDSICCVNCGTVIENVIFKSGYEATSIVHDVLYTNKRKTKKESGASIIKAFEKLANFFQLPEDLITRGKEIIKQHAKEFNKRYPNEISMCVIHLVSKNLKPHWSIQDYFEMCPIPLQYINIVRAHAIIAQHYPNMPAFIWRKPQEEMNSYLERIYPVIKKQVYKDYKGRQVFSCEALKSKTQKLLDLGETYFINSGKRPRTSIITTALLAGLCLRVETMEKRKTVRKISCIRWFDFKSLQSLYYVNSFTLLTYYSEYINLLYACARQIPWIKQPERGFVHYYTSDILGMFCHSNQQAAPMKLNLDQFAVPIFKKSQEKRENMQSIITEAQSYIENENIPEDKTTILYRVYKILLFGYSSEDIFHWTEAYIRSLAHTITLKEEAGVGMTVRMDLDRFQVDEDDMEDKEIEAYLRY